MPRQQELEPMPAKERDGLLSTGIEGLDDVLRGGLVGNRLYLVDGDPGSGKTTLALQFVRAGAARGERCLYVTLSESREELFATAASHGWDLAGIDIEEIASSEDSLHPDGRYTMFHPSEVELAETTKAVLAAAERVRPDRLVVDSLSEFRLLAEHPLRYRRQILALKQHFARQRCTVLLLDDRTSGSKDLQLHSLAHGVVTLDREALEYGSLRRRLRVAKLRGREFSEGYHDCVIRPGGLVVFPRLVASEHAAARRHEDVPSGLPALDALLGGGPMRGTSSLFIGAAGTGKSSLASQFVMAAAGRGERAAIFLFDESLDTCVQRCQGLGMPMERHIDAGLVMPRQVNHAELSPGELAHDVRRAVEQDGVQLVVIDSLNGFVNAMPSERHLALHLHELLTYLGRRGVTTLMLLAQHGLVGADARGPVDASYLADNVLLLRYFEAPGEVRQALSVIKKRTGPHERTIRELSFDGGIHIGEPMRRFHGVMSGMPALLGGARGGGDGGEGDADDAGR